MECPDETMTDNAIVVAVEKGIDLQGSLIEITEEITEEILETGNGIDPAIGNETKLMAEMVR